MKEKISIDKLLKIAAILEILLAIILCALTIFNIRHSSEATKFLSEGGAAAGTFGFMVIGGALARIALGAMGLMSRIKPLLIFSGAVLIVMSIPSASASTIMLTVRIITLAVSILYTACGILYKKPIAPVPSEPHQPES